MPFITALPVDASLTRFPVVGTATVAATASTPAIRPQRFMAASASTAITATGAAGLALNKLVCRYRNNGSSYLWVGVPFWVLRAWLKFSISSAD